MRRELSRAVARRQARRLAPPRDPAAMAEAMARQLDDPPDRARLVAAVEPYRADERASDYLSAIDTCVLGFKS
jgi:hypothetical protein